VKPWNQNSELFWWPKAKTLSSGGLFLVRFLDLQKMNKEKSTPLIPNFKTTINHQKNELQ
jgi:hypothetical protein